MNEPERIIHGPDDALETELLRALRREKPPAHAHARAFKVLGISAGATLSVAATSKAAATSLIAASVKSSSILTTALVVKGAIVGVGIAALVVGAVRLMPIAATSHGLEASAASAQPTARAPAHALPSITTPAQSTAPEIATEPSAPTPNTRERALVRSVPDGRSSKPTASASALASEVELLDKARAANCAHNPAHTLQVLNRYQRQFPRGILGPEAQLLRLEALVQSGRVTEALPLARQMLKAAPTGPHAERIVALLPMAASEGQKSISRSIEDPLTTSQ